MKRLDPPGPPSAPPLVIVMGVAGSGKTTVGTMLARELGCPFWDADRFHSAASMEKMRSGIPLTDDDREPWLRTLREQVVDAVAGKGFGVLACSSLKASHRRMLADGKDTVRFVYLRVTPQLARMRLQQRPSHFMNPDLVGSQFADLEPPDDAIVVDGSLPPAAIVDAIVRGLNAPSVAGASEAGSRRGRDDGSSRAR